MVLIFILAAITLAAAILNARPPAKTESDLQALLPIWKLEKEIILSKAGDATVGLKIELPEIFTLSEMEYESLHVAWLKAIKVLPVGSILHKQDWFTSERYSAMPERSQENFLQQSSDRFFNERPYLAHQCYLYITIKAPGRKPASSGYSSLLRRSMVPRELTDSSILQQLQGSIGQFCRILSDSGFVAISVLSPEEIAGTGKTQGIIDRYLSLSKDQQQPVLKDIHFKPDLKVGSKRCLLFSVADADQLPATCAPKINYDRYTTDRTKLFVGFATPVGQLLPINHIFNQYLVLEDPVQTLKTMEAKRRRLQSLSAYSRENAFSRDATAEYLNEAVAEARTPITAHLNVLCWTEDESQLKEIRNAASAAISKMEVVPHEETVGAPQLWWAGIPGNAAELPENECFYTFAEQATCFFNLETSYRSSKSPFGIRLGDRLTGVPLHVDISDELKTVCTNRNKLVIGGSGSGKSMFMNHLCHSYVLQGAHCVILDVGHSYEGLCKLLGGYYFTYSEANPIKFNPFYIPAGDYLDTEKKESIKSLLVGLWKANDENFRRSEYVAISNSLQSYFHFLSAHKEIFPCFNSYYEFLQQYYIKELEAEKVKDRDFDIHNFLYVLRPFYRNGEFDYILNGTENLELLSQPFVVYELDAIKDHPTLFQVTTLVIAEMFISKMRKLKGIRKVIVIEEAWKAISKAGMAEFIKYLYKTVRKHMGEAITVSQEIDDLISSPVIKEAIINNSDCKILLDLKKFANKFDDIQATLGMTDKGKDLVLSLNRANEPGKRYREVYIELGNTIMKVYRYEPSIEEYYAYSTEQREKMKVQEYTDKYGGDIRKALRAIALEEAA